MRYLLALALMVGGVLMLAGCAGGAIGDASKNPVEIDCSGEVSITGMGTASLIAGLGGGGNNSFSAVFKCAPGSYLKMGPPGSFMPPAPTPTPLPPIQ